MQIKEPQDLKGGGHEGKAKCLEGYRLLSFHKDVGDRI